MDRKFIVLVPGWGDFRGISLWFLRRFLQDQGYEVYIFRGVNWRKIQSSAIALGEFIDSKRVNDCRVILIGHSCGGLVARYLIQKTAYSHFVDGYVSLGTPHKGTTLGNRVPPFGGWFKSARQMAANSNFIQRLNHAEWPSRIQALSIAASHDLLVRPPQNAHLTNAEQLTLPATHLSLALDPRVHRELKSWLSDVTIA